MSRGAGAEPVSVCVPAYNEARSIGATLASVFAQDHAGPVEVLVCANGCADGTERVVREIARTRPLRLLVTEVRGKPNAWNLLLREASHDLVAFADADVRARPNALRELVRRMRAADRPAAVGALSRPVFEGRDPLTRILNPAPRDHGCLVGRLYLVDRVALRARFRERGFAEMPGDIIHEDAWLTILLGRGRWATEPAAVVEYRPARWSDLLAVERRSVRSERQLTTEYARLLEGEVDEALWLNESPERRRARRWERWREARGVGEHAGVVVNFLAKRFLRWLAERQVAGEGALTLSEAFETAESSKGPPPPGTPPASPSPRGPR